MALSAIATHRPYAAGLVDKDEEVKTAETAKVIEDFLAATPTNPELVRAVFHRPL